MKTQYSSLLRKAGVGKLLSRFWRSEECMFKVWTGQRHVAPELGLRRSTRQDPLDQIKPRTALLLAEYEVGETKPGPVKGAWGHWLTLRIDPKGGNSAYPDKKSALDDFSEFIEWSGLPYPTHVIEYLDRLTVLWSLNRFLPTDDWSIAAGRLDGFSRAFGLKSDDYSIYLSAHIDLSASGGDAKMVDLIVHERIAEITSESFLCDMGGTVPWRLSVRNYKPSYGVSCLSWDIFRDKLDESFPHGAGLSVKQDL